MKRDCFMKKSRVFDHGLTIVKTVLLMVLLTVAMLLGHHVSRQYGDRIRDEYRRLASQVSDYIGLSESQESNPSA